MSEKLTLTRKEAAEMLNVSLPTLDEYIHRKKHPMPIFRVGRKYLIPVDLLKKWLSEETTQQ